MNTLRAGMVSRAGMAMLALLLGGCAEAANEPPAGGPAQDGGGSGGSGGTGGAGGSNVDEGGTCTCTPAEIVQCTCAGGGIGTKTCKADCLAYSSCDCSGGTGGDGGTGGTNTGGTGGDGGTGGTAGTGGDGGTGATGGTGGDGGTGGTNTGGTGGTGTGGTGGSCGTADDACPGEAIPLTGTGTNPRTGSATGDTSSLCHDTVGSCGASSSAKDAVYSFTPDIDGTATVTLTGNAVSGWDAVLYARTDCANTSSELKCTDAFNQYTPGGETLTIQVSQGETYYLFVDGYSAASGTFGINVNVIPKGCGNTIIEPPETCDDGNTVDVDFCKNDCTINPNPAGATCPGMPVTLTGVGTQNRTATVSGDTTAMGSNYTASCASSYGDAPDMVFAITPDVDGTMSIDLGSTSWDAVVSVRTVCTSAASEIACEDEPENALISGVAVTANTTYYAILDGYSSAEGPFQFNVKIKPAYCGNNAVEAGEQCDDGDKDDGDGCDHLCQIEPIGPYDVCPGQELTLIQSGAQYIGNLSGATTGLHAVYAGTCGTSTASPDAVFYFTMPVGGTATVSIPTAGTTFDSVLYVREGACEGAGMTQTGCHDVGGNGGEKLTFKGPAGKTYWVFVDGYGTPAKSGDFRLEVTVVPSCGDGVLDTGEACDDGNAAAGDGCGADCTFEAACGTIADAEPNTYDAPNLIPAACGSFLIPHAALTPTADSDHFQFAAIEGAKIDARTYVGTPATCPAGNDLVLSLWKGPITAAGANNSGCSGQTGSVSCNETKTGGFCSTISYTVPTDKAGDYILKVHSWGIGSTVADYGLQVIVK